MIDIVARDMLKTRNARCGEAAIGLVYNLYLVAQVAVFLVDNALENLYRAVLGAVIHEDKLYVWVGLREYRLGELLNVVLDTVDWCYDRYGYVLWHSSLFLGFNSSALHLVVVGVATLGAEIAVVALQYLLEHLLVLRDEEVILGPKVREYLGG